MSSSNAQIVDGSASPRDESDALTFGRFTIARQKRLLLDQGVPVALTPKAFDTLAMLIAHRERVVAKEELLESLWPETSVDEANLSQQIFTLRKILGDNAANPQFISTASRRGYRFIAHVQPVGSSGTTEPSATGPRPTQGQHGHAAVLVAVGVVLASLTGAFWLGGTRTPSGGHTSFKFSVAPPPETTLPENGGSPVLSPDGKQVAFIVRVGVAIGSNQLALRRLDSTDVSLIPHTVNATAPFWSPDSRYLGYFAGASIYRIAVQTMGPPVKIADTHDGWTASWGTRGIILISSSPRGGPLYQVAAAGGEPTAVSTLDDERGERAHLFAAFLPDGERFVYLTYGRADTAGVYVGSLAGGERRRILTDFTAAKYASGHLLYVTRETLVAQPFDPVTAEFLGDATSLVSPMEVTNAGFAPFSASDTGVLVYGDILPRKSRLRWVDRAGRDLSHVTPTARYMDPALVGRGDAVVVAYHEPVSARSLPGSDLFLLGDGRSPRRLTQNPDDDHLPVPSPDGKTVAFSSLRSGGGDLYVAGVDDVNGDRLLLTSPDRKDPTDWSSGGEYLLYENVPRAMSSDLWFLRLADGKPTAFLTSRANEWGGRFSPDGRWVVYTSDESGRHEIFVRSFPDGTRSVRVSHEGARHPFWRDDGAEIYYLADNDVIMAAPFAVTPQGPTVGAATRLFTVRPVRYTSRNAFAPAPDGRRFLINERVETNAARDVKVVVNWSASQ